MPLTWFAVGSCTSVAGKRGRCGAVGRRVSSPRFARGRWRRCWAGIQLRASGRCAGFRDVVSYSCLAGKLLLLGADWSGSQGAAGWFVWGSGLGWVRIKEDSFLLLVSESSRWRLRWFDRCSGVRAGSELKRVFRFSLWQDLPFCRYKTINWKAAAEPLTRGSGTKTVCGLGRREEDCDAVL